ncbi:hypothetical protein [Pontibacter russatus]|uniref:hypothetical protein n=1 Tax=Pontibacter russatus TaxID=2694929 RepID=UPI00137A4755|nr:hypothetical protein [Pontibacter russatus]
MRTKTRIRLLTVFFSITLLCAFGCVPYFTYLDIKESGVIETNLSSLAALFMLLLFVGGLVAIVKYAKVITIDEEKQKVIVLHPLLLKRRVYNFSDIIGFRWLAVNARIYYKSIKLKSTEGRVYQFTDFEVRNFRDMERVIHRVFDLRSADSWRPLSKQQRRFEVQRSRLFDISQAEDIILSLKLGFALITFITFLILHHLYQKDFKISLSYWLLFSVILISIYGVSLKYRKVSLHLENIKQDKVHI